MKRNGRTPMFPDYFPKQFRDRRLVYVETYNTVVDEYQKRYTINTPEALVDYLFDTNSILFLDTFGNDALPFIDFFVDNSLHKVLCNVTGTPSSIRINKGHEARWVVSAPTIWGEYVSDEFLITMRKLFRHCAVGVRPTPSSVGTSLLRAIWKLSGFSKQTAPNVFVQEYLHAHGYGGRCDTPGKGKSYKSLLELDMSSAYLAHFLKLPGGTAYGFTGNRCWQFATFFAECKVTIYSELALGPFPVKMREDVIVYPTLPGIYFTHLWREQIEECLLAGCDVEVKGGVGWRYITDVTDYWCEHMYWLKTLAPTYDVETMVKKTIVSTIGRFGTRGVYYHLVGESLADPSMPAEITDDMQPRAHYVMPERDYTSPSMVHWFNYCIMQCALTLYRFALPYAEQGRLVMTNYDAVLVVERDETHRYIEKHTLASKSVQAGDWRWQRLTNVEILGPRSLRCDQKVVTPGIPEKERESVL